MFSLNVENLEKRFGHYQVFQSLSLQFSDSSLAIGGPNGSGKSTLLKCLAGLIRPSEGSICWYHHDKFIELREMRHHIGFMAPSLNYYGELTARENLEFILRLRGQELLSSNIDNLLEEYGMLQHQHKNFGSLSSGQQQRLKLAAAMVHEPDILFLDEPGTNLDAHGRALVHHVIENSVKQKKQVLLASNDPYELELCQENVSLTPKD